MLVSNIFNDPKSKSENIQPEVNLFEVRAVVSVQFNCNVKTVKSPKERQIVKETH